MSAIIQSNDRDLFLGHGSTLSHSLGFQHAKTFILVPEFCYNLKRGWYSDLKCNPYWNQKYHSSLSAMQRGLCICNIIHT